MAGSTVELRIGTRVDRTTVADASGRFQFDKVVEGIYEIRPFIMERAEEAEEFDV